MRALLRHDMPVRLPLRLDLRECLAAALVLLFLAAIVAAHAWTTHSPAAEVEAVPARILTFRPMRSSPSAGARATVRLDSGLVVALPVPRSARAQHCRAGDRIRLLRRGDLLYFPAEGCSRLSPRS